MRKLLLALALILAPVPALAATCPVIPALPDTERRTEYTGIVSQTGPFNVSFQLYGDSTDTQNWLEVWVNGTKKTGGGVDYTVATASGPAIGAACLPITNAQVTFTVAQTGTIEIVGARRPRRASQVSENAGVTAHAFNQVISDLIAVERERWDMIGRLVRSPPGEALNVLPPAASRANGILGFDATGLIPTIFAPNLGLGTVVGPNTSVDGHVAVFSGTNGQVIRDGGPSVGTVSSVGLALPSIFSVSGSPVTTSGTLNGTLATQSANFFFAGPTSGAAATPNFRAIVSADLPALSTTVNGSTCTIGSSCSVSTPATSVTVGSTAVLSGNTNTLLFQNGASPGGTIGEVATANNGVLVTSATGVPSISNILSSTYFKSGAPWVDVKAFGALGDGSTNDTTAIQNAINSIGGGLGGTVYFPPGVYCAAGGVTVSTAAVHLWNFGGDNTTVQISSCGVDVTPLTLNAFAAGLHGIQVLGGGTTSTHPALVLGSSCTECIMEHARAQGGTNAIKVQGSDFLIFDVHAESSYGSALVYVTGSGYFDRLKADQTWPVSTPSIGAAPSGWASAHSYTTGNVVSTGGFYIQATSNCTSGGGAPTVQNYGVNIADNTCTWKLVAPTTYHSTQFDTGVSFTTMHNGDHTGPFTCGIDISNTLAGAAPQSILITDETMGLNFTAGLCAHDGAGLVAKGLQISNCVVTQCSGVLLSNSWTGDATITNSLIFSNPLGINIAAGTNATISNNSIFNSSGAGVVVQANINQFAVIGNNIGSSTFWGANVIGIQVLAGTSNNYTIVDNITTGAGTAISDSGSGANKKVQAFNSPTTLANGGTNNAVAPSNGGFVWSDASKLNVATGFVGLALGSNSGAPVAYGGTSCTNQFPRSLNASGAATCNSVANTDLVNNATTVAGATCTLGSTCGLTSATNTLGAPVSLTGSYVDGPSAANGTSGTWFASGTVTLTGTTGDLIACKLYDGTTLIASANQGIQNGGSLALSGIITSPAGNIRIACENTTAARGTMASSNGVTNNASTVTAFRIN